MASGLPLDTLGGTIRAHLKKADDNMIAAGQHLIEARSRISEGEGEGLDWKSWLEKEEIGIEKAKVCLRIANDPDPEKALAIYREDARQRKAAQRSRTASVGCDVTPDQSAPEPKADPWLSRMVAGWRSGSPEQRAAFLQHIGY